MRDPARTVGGGITTTERHTGRHTVSKQRGGSRMRLWHLMLAAVAARLIDWWRDRRERRGNDEHHDGKP